MSEKNNAVQKGTAVDETKHIMNTIFSDVKICVLINLTADTYTVMQDHMNPSITWPQHGSYDELMGTVSELIPVEQKEQYLHFFNRERLLMMTQSGEKYLELEHGVMNPYTKQTDWVLSKAYVMEHSEEQDVRIVLITRDTDRAGGRQNSRRREYETVLKHMPGYACKAVFTEDDIILMSASEKYYLFMGAGPELLCGKSLLRGFTEKEKRDICNQARVKVSERKDVYYCGHAYKYNGDKFWLVFNASFFEIQRGLPVYYCVLTNASHVMELQKKAKLYEQEARAAAALCDRTVFSYDIGERKLHTIACAPRDVWMAEINGHAPEYLIERGYASGVNAIVVYDMFSSIERGLKHGEIPFTLAYQGEQFRISCRFSTIYDDENIPVSSIISIVDDSLIKKAEAMDCFFYHSSEATKYNKILIINPRTAQIEYESENEDVMFLADGITSFDVAKERLIRGGFVAPEYLTGWKEFLDSGRLLQCYLSGTYEDAYFYRGNNRFGKNRDFSVSVVIRNSEYHSGIRMYIRFEDLAATAMLKEYGDQTKLAQGALPPKVQIRAFGHFDVFVDGRPLVFSHEKSKEMLAVLVNRRGGFVTTAEMVSYLWEDEPNSAAVQSRCRQVASRLKHILEKNNVAGIIETVNGRRRIIPEKVDCDFFHYMNNEPDAAHLFSGSYMTNYSWSEMTLGDLKSVRFSIE